jgi:transcriptional regulator with XRE-family HTH domain
MELGDKLRHLRRVEGEMRGRGRPLTKAEVVRSMREELGAGVSAAYLSQLEAGRRTHLTAPTRALLARFYRVHPGYLVADPPGYEATLRTHDLAEPRDLAAWLAERADELRDDPPLAGLFERLAARTDPRRDLLALQALLDLDERPRPRAGRNGVHATTSKGD